MAKTDPVNISDPSGLSDPKLGDDYIRTLARAVLELINKDHFIGVATSGAYNEDDAGEHTKITFHAPLADNPAGKTVNSDEAVTDAHEGYLYLKDVANSDEDDVAELHFQDENGNHIQMSAEGYNYLEKPLMPNNTVLKAYNAAKDGFVELFKCNADGEFEFLIKAKLLSDSTTISSSELSFTNGVTEIKVGDVVTGETSGKSGTVRSITLSSGSWAGDDAAGSMQLVGSTGTFTSGEYLKVGAVVEMAKAGTYTAGTVGVIATEDYVDDTVADASFGNYETTTTITSDVEVNDETDEIEETEALTDLLLVATCKNNNGLSKRVNFVGKTGTTSNPTTERCAMSLWGDGQTVGSRSGFVMFVKKGEYYRVTRIAAGSEYNKNITRTYTVIPIGS